MRRCIATVSLSGMLREKLQAAAAARFDRFHFELLERRGGYSGYGAPNAPLRLAAMALWRQSQDPRPAR